MSKRTYPALILKPAKEKSLLRRHPWVFSGAEDRVSGAPRPGDTVEVLSSKGEFLAYAAYNPSSQIRARVWAWDANESIDEAFFSSRIRNAIALRQSLIKPDETDAYRLVYAESDGIPGLIVDRYGDYLVVQFLTAGVESCRQMLVDLLAKMTGVPNIFERSDVDVRSLEGLPERTGCLAGRFPPEHLSIRERDFSFLVDIQRGHKTGFYLDQRDNRDLLRPYFEGRRVLNCFCYTGAFSVYAQRYGAAQVISVDASAEAIALGQKNVELNGLSQAGSEWVSADVFHLLRAYRDRAEKFDLVILDPPKFAPTVAHLEKAARGYKDINLLAFKLLKPGGLLCTFSCSGGVSKDLFQKIVADAALDAGVESQIIQPLYQGKDHPVALNFPESLYLKGLVCRLAG